jgi:hypothetical protein
MAKLIYTGFEMGSRIELSSSLQAGNWTLDFPTGRRAGTFCIRNQSSGNSGNAANWTLNIPGAPTEWYMAFAIMAIGGTKNENIFLGAATSGNHLWIAVGGGLTMTFNNSAGSAIASTTSIIPAGVWTLIEIHYKQHSSTGILQVKVNGVQEINFTGNTQSTSNGGLASFFATTVTGTLGQQIDDLIVHDTSGSVDNSWVGDQFVTMLLPNGDASPNQWTPSTGSNHYAVVDERASNDDTDYLESTTTGFQECWDVTTFTLAAGQEIVAMQSVVVAKRVNLGTPRNLKIGLKAGATTSLDAGRLLATTYTTYRGDIFVNNPDDAQAWQHADMDAVKVVFEDA